MGNPVGSRASEESDLMRVISVLCMSLGASIFLPAPILMAIGTIWIAPCPFRGWVRSCRSVEGSVRRKGKPWVAGEGAGDGADSSDSVAGGRVGIAANTAPSGYRPWGVSVPGEPRVVAVVQSRCRLWAMPKATGSS
jgi:hypothetical protein